MRIDKIQSFIQHHQIKEGSLVRIKWEVRRYHEKHDKVFQFGQVVGTQLLVYDKDDKWRENWQHIPIENIISICIQ